MLRRIPPWLFDFQSNSIHAKAFANDRRNEHYTNSHSVNWQEYTSAQETLKGHPGFGVAELSALHYRTQDQEIKHTPTKCNYGHCDVEGRKSAGVKKRLKKKAKLVVRPTQD